MYIFGVADFESEVRWPSEYQIEGHLKVKMQKIRYKNQEKYIHEILGSLISNPRSADLHHIIERLNKPLRI